MKKEDIYKLLEEKGVWHEITEHGAVWNMEDLANLDLPYPEDEAKNIFVRDDKKRNYYLITVKDDKRVDLKKFQADYETSKLSFVSAENNKFHTFYSTDKLILSNKSKHKPNLINKSRKKPLKR